GLVGLLIFFISFFFLLMDGNRFKKYAFKLLPINALHERQISKRFSSLCYAWIVVSLLLAFIQGSMSAIGFAIISVPSPLIWGIVSMLTAFIPFVGAGIIWGSIAIIYLIIGEWGSALFIVIWGSLLVSSVDNLLRPFLLKQGVKIHPLILFLAVLGGFFAFGVSGLIIGPLVIVFISTLLYIYELEFGEVLLDFHNHKDPKIKQEKE
ncbi:MAG: AI-2E family transporter, partial [Candidatus Gracilibacteria bacterium]|nr:AI-2E family transporter [Candidatus Gracilibacteria bacterium]